MSVELPKTLIKIDPLTVSLYRDFADGATGHEWFLIGAAARDFFLNLHGYRTIRATRDVDFAVQLRDWKEFEDVRTALIQSKKFSASDVLHRLFHVSKLPVDLVPFGEIADENERLNWPDSNVMHVAGYEAALSTATWVQIADTSDLKIRVANPAGLVMLKLFAWADDPPRRTKDLGDIVELCVNYLDFGNWDRLKNGTDSDLTSHEDFSPALAGTKLLGRDIARIAPATIRRKLSLLLEAEISKAEESRMLMGFTTAMNKSNHPQTVPISFMEALQSSIGIIIDPEFSSLKR